MKQLKYYCALLLLASVSLVMVSCSDDEGGGGNGSNTAGVLDKNTGLRVKSFGDYVVSYSDNGRIDYIRDNYDYWKFTYSPNNIVRTDKYGDDEESISVGYNGAGYLVSTSSTYSDKDGTDYWEESSKASLSYDGSGHLTKITGSGKENGTEDGERYSSSWDFNYTLTWRNGLLMQVVLKENEVEDGDRETETETWTYTYDNENYVNAYRQWAPSICHYFSDLEEILAYAGLLGAGPDMLPSSGEVYEEEYYDGKLHENNRNYSYRYGFNSDGSISYTTVNNSRYNFSYDYADVNGRNTRSASENTDIQENNKKSRHNLFRHHSRKNK